MSDPKHDGSSAIRQTAAADKASDDSGPAIPELSAFIKLSASGANPLLTKAVLGALLGVAERKFDQLLADGIIPPPIELGPRCSRWTHEDYLQALQRLPRRVKAAEPPTLAAGRRARIDAMKRGAATNKAGVSVDQRGAA
jgi:predicted DNA-binding transcriptional regulator AlpA